MISGSISRAWKNDKAVIIADPISEGTANKNASGELSHDKLEELSSVVDTGSPIADESTVQLPIDNDVIVDKAGDEDVQSEQLSSVAEKSGKIDASVIIGDPISEGTGKEHINGDIREEDVESEHLSSVVQNSGKTDIAVRIEDSISERTAKDTASVELLHDKSEALSSVVDTASPKTDERTVISPIVNDVTVGNTRKYESNVPSTGIQNKTQSSFISHKITKGECFYNSQRQSLGRDTSWEYDRSSQNWRYTNDYQARSPNHFGR